MRLKVAIIDDSRSMRTCLHDEISKLGEYDIKLYAFGTDFLQGKEKFDIVFLDGTLLNGLSAYDVIKEIVKENPHQYIVMFGGIQLEDIPKWMQRGAKGFISKPPEVGRLKELFDLIE